MTDAFDHAAVDPAVRPQDDLYRHANGHWLATTEIPADKSSTGAFVKLRDEAEEAVRDIIAGSPGGPGAGGQIGDLYASFMAEDRIAELGLAPLRPELARAAGIADATGLAAWLGRAQRLGFGGPVELWVEADPGDPTRTVLFLTQGGIGLPDEAYYREPAHTDIREAYRAHLARMLTLAEIPDAERAAAAVYELEELIAGHHWDIVRTRGRRAAYNPMSRPEAEALVPALDWSEFWAAAGVATTEVIVEQPSFCAGLSEAITATPLATWRLWAQWRVLSALAPYLPAAIEQENFDFRGRTLQGMQEQRARWKRAVSLVEGALGEQVGRIYVDRHFSPVAKARMDTLVANLVAAYRQSITDLDWMTADTRAAALAKLDRFDPQIGYPKKWRDYSSLEIRADDLVGNVLRANEFDFAYTIGKLGQPVDRDEWLMTPQTVNAYYHPFRNQIVFPAAILQPPFFAEDADDALNYGGIGAVIGHEIGHGFDDQGAQFDGDGRLHDWWTPADREAFERRTGSLVAQYSALVPAEAPDTHVNGELTLGENIGDLGGVGIAYLAWQLAGGDASEPIGGYTGAQRFFLNYARIWQTKIRPEALKQRIATDPHSPSEFRCNQIVKNVPAFVAAFAVQEGDGLWLDPALRVKIW